MQPETRNTIRKNNKILMKGLRVITSEAPSWQPSSEHSLSSPKIKHSNEYLKSPKNLHIFCTLISIGLSFNSILNYHIKNEIKKNFISYVEDCQKE